jgi:hypothetical protein
MSENYHPYEYVTVIEQADGQDTYCSVVVERNVADSLHSFLGRIDDLKVSALMAKNEKDKEKRFQVNCTRTALRFLLRKWAAAWRAARNETYPPIDVVRVQGKENADIADILGKQVRAVHRGGADIVGKVVEIDGDFSERLCIARLMVSEDRTQDRYLNFGEVREFQILP